MKLQQAVKKESLNILIYTVIGVIVMFAIFLILKFAVPDGLPEVLHFDITVILGGLCGGAVAFLNFFLMAVTVQKVSEIMSEPGSTVEAAPSEASEESSDAEGEKNIEVSPEAKKKAQKLMKLSYSRRFLFQIIWVVIAVLAPCFNLVAGLLPLLFPGIGIKTAGYIKAKRG